MAKQPTKTAGEEQKEEKEAFTPPPRPELPSKDGRTHRASYATDNMKGGYNIRVVGPHATKMGKRWLPVTRVDGSENMEFTLGIIWSGIDEKTEQPIALFHMYRAPKSKDANDEIPF
jgi:hypothetical protein